MSRIYLFFWKLFKKYPDNYFEIYWHARCEECGWHGLSSDCDGGGPIADTGDYDDITCPKCHGQIYDYDGGFSIKDRLLWGWRCATLWTWRKKRYEEKQLDEFIKQAEERFNIAMNEEQSENGSENNKH